MTEAEIMKALEDQKGVHLANGVFVCDARDLLNRKNEEIERLKKIINTSAIILPARQCGKTFLIKTTIEKITESARTAARAEAIKEFAEKVITEGEKQVNYYTPEGCDFYFRNGTTCGYVVMKNTITKTAKEMGVEL